MRNRSVEEQKTGAKKRIGLIDELRGFAVVIMLIYHTLYLCDVIFALPVTEKLFYSFMPVKPLSGIFIIVAGISSACSRSNLRRGLKLLAVALGITLVTALLLPLVGMDGFGIYFGVLHLLSVSILLFSFLRPLISKIPPVLGIGLCVLFYILTAGIGEGYLGIPPAFILELPPELYELPYLFPFGIITEDFASADYFPVFPKIFMFFAGTCFGGIIKNTELPDSVYRVRIKPLAALGRRALAVYVIHIPVLYAVICLIKLAVNLF